MASFAQGMCFSIIFGHTTPSLLLTVLQTTELRSHTVPVGDETC
jgi:hypothetical protein